MFIFLRSLLLLCDCSLSSPSIPTLPHWFRLLFFLLPSLDWVVFQMWSIKVCSVSLFSAVALTSVLEFQPTLFFWTCLPEICRNARNTKGESMVWCSPLTPWHPSPALKAVYSSRAHWMLVPALCHPVWQWLTPRAKSPPAGLTDCLSISTKKESRWSSVQWREGGWRNTHLLPRWLWTGLHFDFPCRQPLRGSSLSGAHAWGRDGPGH